MLGQFVYFLLYLAFEKKQLTLGSFVSCYRPPASSIVKYNGGTCTVQSIPSYYVRPRVRSSYILSITVLLACSQLTNAFSIFSLRYRCIVVVNTKESEPLNITPPQVFTTTMETCTLLDLIQNINLNAEFKMVLPLIF